MQTQATAKYIRIAPRKVRLVVDMVRGLTVAQAEPILQFSKKSAAEPVWKLIKSAAANAKQQYNLEYDQLKIAQIYADEGFVMKRFKARAFGRAGGIMKRTSHISVVLASLEQAAPAQAKKAKAVKTPKAGAKKGETVEAKKND
ncbi:MAG: 50S ribosomal protein L22 [Candidatus Kerfeldbacteria bacterium]|nr:50S ribosomal protein L22 [Candidatus Kerfeldbacteria bacterium]